MWTISSYNDSSIPKCLNLVVNFYSSIPKCLNLVVNLFQARHFKGS